MSVSASGDEIDRPGGSHSRSCPGGALLGFRLFFGAWLLAAPWLLGHRLDGWAIHDALAGAVVLGTAGLCERSGAARLLQSLLGLWLMAAPFVFDVELLPMCSDFLVGKTLLVSGAAVSTMFAAETMANE